MRKCAMPAVFLAIAVAAVLILGSTTPASADDCMRSGQLPGVDVGDKCDKTHGAECCKAGDKYDLYYCSPPVMTSGPTPATLTVNSFKDHGDGGAKPKCDGQWHEDDELVVALSTGWLNAGKNRCPEDGPPQYINIYASNGKMVMAKVVDECDSTMGCDQEHDFQPPCGKDTVDGSPAVWTQLGLDEDEGKHPITWSDA